MGDGAGVWTGDKRAACQCLYVLSDLRAVSERFVSLSHMSRITQSVMPTTSIMKLRTAQCPCGTIT
jgi:hypothetical protein